MDRLEYNGRTYTRYSDKWVDSSYLTVNETLQAELNTLYIQTQDFSAYSVEELVEEGDKFKASGTYRSAIAFYEMAIEKCCDCDTLRGIFPRITSCYRQEHLSYKVIELFASTKKMYGESFITPVLLTSVAAAYCDVHEYENALRCCRWAYKRFDGEYQPFLSNVFARIKKESGLGMDFDD